MCLFLISWNTCKYHNNGQFNENTVYEWCEQWMYSESQFFHEKVDVVVLFKSMQVVGITLKPHQEATKWYISRQAPTSISSDVITLDPVDLSVHHILKAVCSWWSCFWCIELWIHGISIFLQGFCKHQSELVTKLHRVDPYIDVQNQIHFEWFRLTMESTCSLKLFSFRVYILNIKDIFKQHSCHFERAQKLSQLKWIDARLKILMPGCWAGSFMKWATFPTLYNDADSVSISCSNYIIIT